MSDGLLAEADELYALDPADFTPARDARAKELKGTPLAAQVKKLRKPSLAAWVVNLLVRHETEQVEQVLEVGTALRAAQESMSADELRALTKQRRQLTAAVTTRARALSREHGQRVTQSVADQVEATLTAAMVDESCARAVRSGMLIAPLSATGVDEVDLTGAVALPEALGFEAPARDSDAPAEKPRPELRVVPDPEADAKARAAAEEALEEADAELEQARDAHTEATTAVEELEARSMQLQSEIDELRRRIVELETAYEEVDDEIAEAEDARTEAEEALAEATRARERAAEALARLER
ncbi:hypothetical protein [Nocardioides sp. SYSU D00038]|uniref:hypothetical protein n=1 Tax=Nocardioides sp. SYSU D00038 TaxID=2812554 RepID=UPI001967C3C5|nr:hypothetical protein [Nocardioides sp. SYSU D00038]